MPGRRVTLLQGTLDLLILKALSAGALHGLGVSRRIKQITGGTFVVQPGSLFPALHRLEEAGWLYIRLAPLREQPTCEVLHAHKGRTPTTGRRSHTVESDFAGNCARDESMR